MKRETSNILRTILEDWIPPVLRDTWFFRWLFGLAFGQKAIISMAELRRRAPYLSDADFERFYQNDAVRVHEGTDNSEAVLAALAEHCLAGRVLDVGCGTGATLRFLRAHAGNEASHYTGVDYAVPEAGGEVVSDGTSGGIAYQQGDVLKLGFDDDAFDTVICSHVLEHVLDIRAAIAELRRVTARRLIIVVPREREYIHNFNPHLHFFPYLHAFLRVMIPLPQHHHCRLIGRDIFYVEDAHSLDA